MHSHTIFQCHCLLPSYNKQDTLSYQNKISDKQWPKIFKCSLDGVRKLVSYSLLCFVYFLAVKISPSGQLGLVTSEQVTVKCQVHNCNNAVIQVATYKGKGIENKDLQQVISCTQVNNTSDYTCSFGVDMKYNSSNLKCGLVVVNETIYSNNLLQLHVQG